ncbi:MAG: hypothetical protein ACI4VW_03135 [Acutalibacteraceae bacterium]
MFFTQLAATAVVVTTAIVVARCTATAVTTEQNEDYKDDNPSAAITVVEEATHSLNPLSMHNMLFRFFCYKRNICLFEEKNKTEISLKGGENDGLQF